MKKIYIILLLVALVLCAGYFFLFAKKVMLNDDTKLEYFLKKRGVSKKDYEPFLSVKDEYGCTLKDIMAQAIKDWNVDTRLGVKVCSATAYNELYGNVLDKLIVWYHRIDADFKHKSDLDVTKISNLQIDPQQKYIISTRARFARNISGQPFRKAQDLANTLKTESILSGALQKLSGNLKGKYYRLSTLSDAEKESFIREHLLFADMKKSESMVVSGIYKDFYPEGSGIFLNSDKTFIAWVNEEDHLRIISLLPNADMKQVFTNLVEAAQRLDKDLEFAKSEKYGYLGSCPSNIGTTLRASFLIKLPQLAKNMDLLQKIAKANGLDIRSSNGEEGSKDDVTFDISNEARIGNTEVELINRLILGAAEIIQTEQKLESEKK